MFVQKRMVVCLFAVGSLINVYSKAQFIPNPAVKSGDQPSETKSPSSGSKFLSWRAIDNALANELITKDLGELAREAVSHPVANTEIGRMRSLAIFLRAGYHKDALQLIRRLPVMRTKEQSDAWAGALDTLYHYQDWPLTASLLDRMPRVIPGWTQYYIDYRLKTEKPEEIDLWIKRRLVFAPDYWLSERIELWNRFHQVDRVLDPLAADIRRHPTDFARAVSYLRAVRYVPAVSAVWMGAICRPPLAMKSFQLGTQLANRSRAAAVVLFLRSLRTPFTLRDAHWYYDNRRSEAMISARPPSAITETQLRDWTKMALAESYLALGSADKAQPLLEEVSARNPGGLPSGYGQFAGQTQAASGARVIEKRILKAETEPENQNSPQYWTTRAEYYTGRKEYTQALEDYEKALELTRKDPSATDFARSIALNNTTHFLFVAYGAERAVQWAYQQLETADPSSDYADGLIGAVLSHQNSTTHYIHPDDPRLWSFIAAQQIWQWGHTGVGQLLQEMALATPAAERAAFWGRVGRLTVDADSSRLFAMGEALWSQHEWELMIPVMQTVIPILPRETEQGLARSELFQAYIETNKWQLAKEMLDNRQRGLPIAYECNPTTLQQVAQAAARAGALPDAFGLWKRAVNIDRREAGDIRGLAQLGLRSQLREYYRVLKVEEPQYDLPDMFLDKPQYRRGR